MYKCVYMYKYVTVPVYTIISTVRLSLYHDVYIINVCGIAIKM